MSWLKRNWVGAIGAALLAAVLVFGLPSLTSTPALNGNESWYSASIWSVLHGHGYEPHLLSGSGLYDGIPDYWASRLAVIPNLLGELVLPRTLGFGRIVVFLLGLVALWLFWLGMRRVVGTQLGILATAAFAATWGYFSVSHSFEWDMHVLLTMCGLLALLAQGPPSIRIAAIAGVILGLGLDYANSIPAAIPGVALLCAWEPARRWERLGALAAGVAAGVFAYVLLHFAPSFNFAEASDQFDLLFRPIGYGTVPAVDALKELSLGPLLDERDRYTGALYGVWQPILITLALGGFAAAITMLRTLVTESRWLPIVGFAGLAVIAAAPILGGTPHTELRDLMMPLIGAGTVLAVIVAVDTLRTERPYPTEAVPAILLIGLLLGWTLMVGFKTVAYALYGVPFAVGAFAAVLPLLSPPPLRTVVPVAGLVAATIASSLHVASEIRNAPPEAALDGEASEVAREVVPEGKTVMGELIYWWLYEDERFRTNISIWLQEWDHPDEPFSTTFHRLCPDYVLLDDVWLNRYNQAEGEGRLFPNVAPTDPAERDRLESLLRDEYVVVEEIEVDERTLTFWRRRASDCPQPGETASASRVADRSSSGLSAANTTSKTS